MIIAVVIELLVAEGLVCTPEGLHFPPMGVEYRQVASDPGSTTKDPDTALRPWLSLTSNAMDVPALTFTVHDAGEPDML